MEESRLAHEKEVARLRIRRKEIQKYMNYAMMGGVIWIFGMGIVWLLIALLRV